MRFNIEWVTDLRKFCSHLANYEVIFRCSFRIHGSIQVSRPITHFVHIADRYIRAICVRQQTGSQRYCANLFRFLYSYMCDLKSKFHIPFHFDFADFATRNAWCWRPLCVRNALGHRKDNLFTFLDCSISAVLSWTSQTDLLFTWVVFINEFAASKTIQERCQRLRRRLQSWRP